MRDKEITQNFHLSEFDSKDGAAMPDDVRDNVIKLACNLQTIRDFINVPINVNSGYRSPAHNERVGGAKQSQHLTGNGADIWVSGLDTRDLYDIIDKLMDAGKIEKGGIRLYNSFVHYDRRGHKVTW